MHYNKEIGIFIFDGDEEDVAFRFMWACLCDLSFWGMIETIWRIILRKPPQRYWDYGGDVRCIDCGDGRIKLKLSGWADGLGDDPKKIYFPLQIAMYEVHHDCDWNFEVKIEGDVVYKPWKISVHAKRCHSQYYHDNIVENKLTHIEFNFEVPQYTLANVYEGAVRELKRKRETKL